jgi:hypothetical protein
LTQVQQKWSDEQINSASSAILTLSKMIPGDNENVRIASARRIYERMLDNWNNGNLRNSSKELKSTLWFEGLAALSSAYRRKQAKQLLKTGSDSWWTPADRPTNWRPLDSDESPRVNDNAKPSPDVEDSHYQNRQECLQNFVNNGYSVGAANTACDEYFPSSSKGGTTTKTYNIGRGGKSTVTTRWPAKGELKKASREVSVPSWAISTGLADVDDTITLDTHLRSASRPYWLDSLRTLSNVTDSTPTVQTTPTKRRQATYEEDDVPYWAVSLNMV